MNSVYQHRSEEFSKSTIQYFFRFFAIRGDPCDLGGFTLMATPKRGRKKRERKIHFWNQHDETNPKMGGRSLLRYVEHIGSSLQHSSDLVLQGFSTPVLQTMQCCNTCSTAVLQYLQGCRAVLRCLNRCRLLVSGLKHPRYYKNTVNPKNLNFRVHPTFSISREWGSDMMMLPG